MKKDVHKIPNNRLRKLRVKLLTYDVVVKYIPGKKMYAADLLSRNYIIRHEISE